jgi:hypothetical protein
LLWYVPWQITWSYIYGQIEMIKDGYEIETYSVGQTSLEEIFVGFARGQRIAPVKKKKKKKE